MMQFFKRLRCWLNFGHVPRSRVYIVAAGEVVELSCDCRSVVESRVVFPHGTQEVVTRIGLRKPR